MKIIYNDYIPFKGYVVMNIFGVLFVRNDLKHRLKNSYTINHESIHTAQYKELLWVFFLPLYILEFIIKLFVCISWDKAYRSISLEQEAYYFEYDANYLSRRKPYQWVKYIFGTYNSNNKFWPKYGV